MGARGLLSAHRTLAPLHLTSRRDRFIGVPLIGVRGLNVSGDTSAMKQRHDFRAIANCFQINGELVAASALGSGHINDTFSLVFDPGGPRVRYVLQRINHGIFEAPAALMENVQRVTAHLAAKLAGEPDRTRRTLTLVPARDGRS